MGYSLGNTASQLAKLFHCSLRTIYNVCKRENIRLKERYTTISDAELKTKIEELHVQFPNSGAVVIHT